MAIYYQLLHMPGYEKKITQGHTYKISLKIWNETKIQSGYKRLEASEGHSFGNSRRYLYYYDGNFSFKLVRR